MTQTVFFLDIDDCLIKTSRLTQVHLEEIIHQLSKIGILRAKEITREFAISFKRLYDQHQGNKLDLNNQKMLGSYMKRLTELELPVLEKYKEVKRWSREVCLFIAAEKYGMKLTNQQILPVINSLWEKITQYATFYSDAKQFLDYLITKRIPIYLITSSDSRLILDDKTGLFHYDPRYSKNLKFRRLSIFFDLGIPRKNIFVGDPIDKPKTFVFEEALKQAHQDLAVKFISYMVSDSLTNDLLPAKKIGIDKLILLNRKAQKERELRNDQIVVLKSLSLKNFSFD